ncbi:hypothetical protein [uncultured Ruminococcus sp.]|nr:hypothetical protein [uncultured Ruminococcus sp.]
MHGIVACAAQRHERIMSAQIIIIIESVVHLQIAFSSTDSAPESISCNDF